MLKKSHLSKQKIFLNLLSTILIMALIACDAPNAPMGEFKAQSISIDQGIELNLGEAQYLPTFDGTWLAYAQVSTCVDIGRSLEQMTRSLYLVQTKELASGALEEEWDACHLELSPILSIQTLVPPALRKSVYPVSSKMGFAVGINERKKYLSGPMIELWGLNMENPLSEPFIEDENDPRIFDQDQDGNPGGTLELGTACLAYMVQRTINYFQGEMVSADRIKGDVFSDSEQLIVDATSSLCKTRYATRAQPRRSIFERIRIDGQGNSLNLDRDLNGKITCDEVLDVREQLFDRLPLDDQSCRN